MCIALRGVGTSRETEEILHGLELKIGIRFGDTKQGLVPDKSRGSALGEAVVSK